MTDPRHDRTITPGEATIHDGTTVQDGQDFGDDLVEDLPPHREPDELGRLDPKFDPMSNDNR